MKIVKVLLTIHENSKSVINNLMKIVKVLLTIHENSKSVINNP